MRARRGGAGAGQGWGRGGARGWDGAPRRSPISTYPMSPHAPRAPRRSSSACQDSRTLRPATPLAALVDVLTLNKRWRGRRRRRRQGHGAPRRSGPETRPPWRGGAISHDTPPRAATCQQVYGHAFYKASLRERGRRGSCGKGAARVAFPRGVPSGCSCRVAEGNSPPFRGDLSALCPRCCGPRRRHDVATTTPAVGRAAPRTSPSSNKDVGSP